MLSALAINSYSFASGTIFANQYLIIYSKTNENENT